MSLNSINTAELRRVSKICERLHCTCSAEPFSNHLYVVLSQALPSIHFMSIHFLLSPLVLKQAINQSLPDQSFKGFIRYMHQHPGIQRYCASNQPVGTLLTELSPVEYRMTELYNEVYRPADIEDQAWIGVGDRKELIALSYSRDTAYTERDLLMLSMIQPQANIAWKNWKRIRALEKQLKELQTAQIETEQLAQELSAMQTAIQALTRRQLEVVELVATGKTNVEIADALAISPRTIAKHLEQIFRVVTFAPAPNWRERRGNSRTTQS
ncbi:helix-turn-helix transcriptional regulator [Pontiellaceae bacterium B1224]|nr:helix-turn-helix transcriptional regulator [Pontiellaceae bacterium B1224]